MENITVNVFDDVLYLAWEFVYLIFFPAKPQRLK